MKRWIPFARVIVPAMIVTLTLSPALATAQSTAGGASLQIPPGARAEGMGRFYNAVADDAFAPWWNPAGLSFMRGWNAGLMHVKLVPDLADDVFFEYAGVSKYIEGWGGVAFTFTYLNYGESIQTAPGSPTEIDRFSSFEFSPSIALGTQVLPSLGVGANLKLLHVDLAGQILGGEGKGTTFGVDLGGLFRTTNENASFFGSAPAVTEASVGLTVSNLGPDIALVDERQTDPLPRNAKFAVSYGVRIPESWSLLAGVSMEKSLVFEDIPDSVKSELTFADRNELLFGGGVEFGILDLAFGRLGYIYDDPGEIKGFTFGAGFYLKQFGLDIASIPQFRELDRVTKFSVTARF